MAARRKRRASSATRRKGSKVWVRSHCRSRPEKAWQRSARHAREQGW